VSSASDRHRIGRCELCGRWYSDLRDGGEVAGVAMTDDGAQESRDCVTA